MGILARIIQKKAGQAAAFFQKKGQRIDLDWPLNIRLGSTVRIDPSLFILAGDDLKLAAPPGDCVVAAAGTFILGQMKHYRFYLKDTAEDEWFLQLTLDSLGAASGTMLYQTLDEVFPETDEDWDLWLNEETGLIGFKDFQTPDGIAYQRVWKQGGPDYTAPWSYDETITDDPFAAPVLETNHCAMLYGRTLGQDVVENLMVDKIEDDEGACIQISAGIEIPAVSLNIL